MKNKKRFTKKLVLNKETVANLSRNEMKVSLAGETPTMIGGSCRTVQLCCVNTNGNNINGDVVRGMVSMENANCKDSKTPFCESIVNAICQLPSYYQQINIKQSGDVPRHLHSIYGDPKGLQLLLFFRITSI